MSAINMTYNGQNYTLEFTRRTVAMMEKRGFRYDEVDELPLSSMIILFDGAFLKNHPGLKPSLIDEIYEHVPEKEKFMEALTNLLSETIETLSSEPDDEGKAVWGVTE